MQSKTANKHEWETALRTTKGPKPAQRGIWAHFASHADYKTGAGIYPSQGSAAEVLGVDPKTVGRAVRAAVRQGWLTEDGRKRNPDGSQGVKVYRLSVPIEDASKGTEEKPAAKVEPAPKDDDLDLVLTLIESANDKDMLREIAEEYPHHAIRGAAKDALVLRSRALT